MIIPSQYEIDIISIGDADSIAEAYNAAMESSDAKYKVYLHQDVFIYNTNFIAELINIFQMHEGLGLLGVLGGVNLPQNAVVWNAWNRGFMIKKRKGKNSTGDGPMLAITNKDC